MLRSRGPHRATADVKFPPPRREIGAGGVFFACRRPVLGQPCKSAAETDPSPVVGWPIAPGRSRSRPLRLKRPRSASHVVGAIGARAIFILLSSLLPPRRL